MAHVLPDTKHKGSYPRGMNKLPLAKRVQILAMLCEGSSMRSISRVADVSINTVSKLLCEAGEACLAIHDETVKGVKASRVQCDEIWSFCYAKEKNAKVAKAAPDGAGDVWTWTALDADTKLIVSYFVGDRSGQSAIAMDDLRARIENRFQLTTDGHRAHLEAAFGGDVDYAMLHKIYGPTIAAPGRYSPAECIGTQKADRGQPRRGARLNVLRRAPEPHDAHVDAALHPPHQCLQQEARKPHSRAGALLRLLQLLPHP
jgi:lambda repressor-like predicted transcriptional regulator